MKGPRGGADVLATFIPLVPTTNNDFRALGKFYKPGGLSTWKLSSTPVHVTATSISCSSRLRKRSAPPFHSTQQARPSRTQRLNEKIELFHPLVPNRALSPKWLCTLPGRLHNEILAASYVNPLIPVRASWNLHSGHPSATKMPNKRYVICSISSLFY